MAEAGFSQADRDRLLLQFGKGSLGILGSRTGRHLLEGLMACGFISLAL